MSRERKYILIAGIILLLIGLIYRFMPDSGAASGDDITAKQAKLAKYQEMVQQKAGLEAKLAALTEQVKQAEAGLSSKETPALASADIQNIINKIAEKSHVEITAVRVLKAEEADEKEFLRLPIQLTFNSTTRQLKDLLYDIEASPKILRIGDMTVRMIRMKPEEQIQTTLTVNGYMKKGKEGTQQP